MLRTGILGLALVMPVVAGPRADYARGVLERMRGGDAMPWMEKALAADPDARPLVGVVAEGRLAAGDLEGATTLMREFAERNPERLVATLDYVDFLRRVAPHDDFAARLAGAALEGAGERFPAHAGVTRRQFRVYEQRGMRAESRALFESVAESGSALLAAEMARTLFESDDAEARARLDGIFRKAMADTPGDPVLARAASEHFRGTGRPGEAAEMLRMHVAADPASLELRVRLGILLFSDKRIDEGEKELLEVVEIDPGQALAHQALAKSYRRRERPDLARPHAAEVLKIRGGDAGEFVGLADEFLAADLAREARLLLEKGMFHHPDDAGIAVRLAIAVRRDPSTKEKAARFFREAESLSGSDGPATEPEFQREFAEVLLEQGKSRLAEDRLRAAIRAYTADEKREMASAMRRLAEIWRSEIRNEEAAGALLKRAELLEE